MDAEYVDVEFFCEETVWVREDATVPNEDVKLADEPLELTGNFMLSAPKSLFGESGTSIPYFSTWERFYNPEAEFRTQTGRKKE